MIMKGSPLLSGLFQRTVAQENDLSFSSASEENVLLADELSNDPDDELLVAYLDNELNDQEIIDFQKRLDESPELREKLRELRTSWNLLDELQTSPLDPRLTQSTLEMVAVAAENQLDAQRKKNRRKLFGRIVFFIAFFGLTTVLTNRIVSVFVPSQTDRLKQDAPLLVYLDQLETVAEFDFLTRLDDSGLFASSFSESVAGDSRNGANFPNNLDDRNKSDLPLESNIRNDANRFNESKNRNNLNNRNHLDNKNIRALSNDSEKSDARSNVSNSDDAAVKTLERRLATRSPLQDSEISLLLNDRDFFRKQEKFYRTSSEKQNQFREFYQKIVRSERSDRLFDVMSNYYNWFQLELHEIQRDQVLSTPIDERIPLIQRLYQETKFKFKPQNNNFNGFVPFRGENSDRQNRFGRPWGNDGSFGPMENRIFQASRSKNLLQTLKKEIPEELRNENTETLGTFFEKFVTKNVQNGTIPADGTFGQNAPGLKDLSVRFIDDALFQEYVAQLSPEASRYFEQASVDDKQKAIDLLLNIGRFERSRKNPEEDVFRSGEPNDFGRSGSKRNRPWETPPTNAPDRPGTTSDPNRQTSPFAIDPFGAFGQNRGPGGDLYSRTFSDRGDAAGFFWKTESTQELAETLRDLPQERKDELLSLPSDEMYARLLMIHWGYGNKKDFLRFPPPNAPDDFRPENKGSGSKSPQESPLSPKIDRR